MSDSEKIERIREILTKADFDYMDEDTHASAFAERLLDKLAEVVPFERTLEPHREEPEY